MDAIGVYTNNNRVIKSNKNVWFQVDVSYPVGFNIDISKYKEGDIVNAGSMLCYDYSLDKAFVINSNDTDKFNDVIGLTQSDIYIGKDVISATTNCVVKGIISLDLVDNIPMEVVNNLKGIIFTKTVIEKGITRTMSFNNDFNNDMDIKVVNN